jgi:Domain of unknown function (DUF4926)
MPVRSTPLRNSTGCRTFSGVYLSNQRSPEEKDVSDEPIPELSIVKLTHSLEHRARLLPEGTVGTVVHAWSDGEHYAVEFAKPFPCVLSLARADIRRLA